MNGVQTVYITTRLLIHALTKSNQEVDKQPVSYSYTMAGMMYWLEVVTCVNLWLTSDIKFAIRE